MHVTSLEIHNFRSFVASGVIPLDQINVLIGENNAGKSSVLKALQLIQQGHADPFSDVRVGSKQQAATAASIVIRLTDIADFPQWRTLGGSDSALYTINITAQRGAGGSVQRSLHESAVTALPNAEPDHFVVPYLSKRKTAGYHEDVRDQYARQISNDLTYLAAKLSRLSNSSFPGNEQYVRACREILGFVVTAVPSVGGQRAGVYLDDRQTLFIDQMGEGVPNIVGLLADLTLAEGKLFLIEEPENDLHPRALKALLDLILESAKTNQFVISTHSNIVVRHLASAPHSRLFNISATRATFPPVASIAQVESTVSARLEVLRDLGYAFADFDLWDGWMILEESSAERIIRDYLIPWFCPKLARIRTVAVGGTGNVEPTFEDFQRMVRFTHLEQAYAGAVWVRVDGDSSGQGVVATLRTRYPTWAPDRFQHYSQPQFEHYYPEPFAQSAELLAIANKQAKRAAKTALLNEVRAWLDADAMRGRVALEISAAEILQDLRVMEQQLSHRTT